MPGRMEAPKVGEESENASSSGIRIAAKGVEKPKASYTSITSCQKDLVGQTLRRICKCYAKTVI
jgi:hypothetical protein